MGCHRPEVRRDGAVRLPGGQVPGLGDASALIATHPDLPVIGAHSHGRGLSPMQKDVLYDDLENAFID